MGRRMEAEVSYQESSDSIPSRKEPETSLFEQIDPCDNGDVQLKSKEELEEKDSGEEQLVSTVDTDDEEVFLDTKEMRNDSETDF